VLFRTFYSQDETQGGQVLLWLHQPRDHPVAICHATFASGGGFVSAPGISLLTRLRATTQHSSAVPWIGQNSGTMCLIHGPCRHISAPSTAPQTLRIRKYRRYPGRSRRTRAST